MSSKRGRRKKGTADAIAELAGGSLTHLSAAQFLHKLNTGWRPGGGTMLPGTVLAWWGNKVDERIAACMTHLQIEHETPDRLTAECAYKVFTALRARKIAPQIVSQAEDDATAATAAHFGITAERVSQITRKAKRDAAKLGRAARERMTREQESAERQAEVIRVVRQATKRLKDPFYRELGPLDEIDGLAAGKALDSDSLHRAITMLAKAFLKADAQDPPAPPPSPPP